MSPIIACSQACSGGWALCCIFTRKSFREDLVCVVLGRDKVTTPSGRSLKTSEPTVAPSRKGSVKSRPMPATDPVGLGSNWPTGQNCGDGHAPSSSGTRSSVVPPRACLTRGRRQKALLAIARPRRRRGCRRRGASGAPICWRPWKTAHRRTVEMPVPGHKNCPVAATISAHPSM